MNSLRARRIEFARRAINHEDPCHLYRLALIAIQPWRDNDGEDQSEFKRIKNLLDRAIDSSKGSIFPDADIALGYIYMMNVEDIGDKKDVEYGSSYYTRASLFHARRFYENYKRCINYDSHNLMRLSGLFIIFTTIFCFAYEKGLLNGKDRVYFKEAVPTIITATAQDDEVKSMIDEIMFGE
jgi:hypothetical protein